MSENIMYNIFFTKPAQIFIERVNIAFYVAQRHLAYVNVSGHLPGYAGAVVVGRRRCGVEGRTGWAVKVGVVGWEAPCPIQGASPALLP